MYDWTENGLSNPTERRTLTQYLPSGSSGIYSYEYRKEYGQGTGESSYTKYTYRDYAWGTELDKSRKIMFA